MTTLRVTAAIATRDDKILIARRAPGRGPLSGLWEFPGGKIEKGETPEECLAREFHEEFGVRARIGAFVCLSRHAYPHAEIELLAYRVEPDSLDLALRDHDQTAWVTIAELGDYELAPADLPIAAALRHSV